MTTPLMISESVPLEVKKILDTLELGRRVKYETTEGFIDFICEQYLTICFKQKKSQPGSFREYENCSLVVFREYWEELWVDDSHMHDVRAYRGKVNEHPGNEMLPYTPEAADVAIV